VILAPWRFAHSSATDKSCVLKESALLLPDKPKIFIPVSVIVLMPLSAVTA
jgi:hypothetical protein